MLFLGRLSACMLIIRQSSQIQSQGLGSTKLRCLHLLQSAQIPVGPVNSGRQVAGKSLPSYATCPLAIYRLNRVRPVTPSRHQLTERGPQKDSALSKETHPERSSRYKADSTTRNPGSSALAKFRPGRLRSSRSWRMVRPRSGPGGSSFQRASSFSPVRARTSAGAPWSPSIASSPLRRKVVSPIRPRRLLGKVARWLHLQFENLTVMRCRQRFRWRWCTRCTVLAQIKTCMCVQIYSNVAVPLSAIFQYDTLSWRRSKPPKSDANYANLRQIKPSCMAL